MGRKISVDSATMMNKGLEVIEAHWLFGAPRDRIEVVIHPQSVIHSMVEYVDGSVLAQLGHPDMRTPIAQALAFPERIDAGVGPLDLPRLGALSFETPDLRTLSLPAAGVRGARRRRHRAGDAQCRQRGRRRGVPRGSIRFTDIAAACAEALARVAARPVHALDDALARRRRGARVRTGLARTSGRGAGSAGRGPGRLMDILQKLLSFLVVLSVLVVIHELGHYWVARRCGVKVLRFSVGFGRVVCRAATARIAPSGRSRRSRSAGTSRWPTSARASSRRPTCRARSTGRRVGKRIAIAAAGPIANLLLAVLLFAGTFVAGVPGQRALLAEPRPGTPAAAAGIRAGDLVVAVDGTPVKSWQELRWRLLAASGRREAVLAVAGSTDRGADEPVQRVLSLAPLAMTDWEGNFMPLLGLVADFGAPLIDDVLPGKPAQRAGLRAGDHIVAIDGTPVRSPADGRRAHQCQPRGSGHVPDRPRRRPSRTSR